VAIASNSQRERDAVSEHALVWRKLESRWSKGVRNGRRGSSAGVAETRNKRRVEMVAETDVEAAETKKREISDFCKAVNDQLPIERTTIALARSDGRVDSRRLARNDGDCWLQTLQKKKLWWSGSRSQSFGSGVVLLVRLRKLGGASLVR